MFQGHQWSSCPCGCCCRLLHISGKPSDTQVSRETGDPSCWGSLGTPKDFALGQSSPHFAFPNTSHIKRSWKARAGLFCSFACNLSACGPDTIGCREGGGENEEVISPGAVCHSRCADFPFWWWKGTVTYFFCQEHAVPLPASPAI